MSLLLFVVAYFAGLLGSLSGIGGGIVIVPLLLYGFGVDLPIAVACSLLTVVATSVGTTATLLPRGYTLLRLSLFLETGSVLGAIFGAKIAPLIPIKGIAFLFSIVLFYAAYQGFRGPPPPKEFQNNGSSRFFDFSYYFKGKSYDVHHPYLGWFLMVIGGILSGLLGIGSGSFNVVIFERLMGLPLLVATATSSSIIGITAAASGWTYFERGLMEPSLILPLVPGVLLGSLSGASLTQRLPVHVIRLIFSTVLLAMGARMLWGAL